MEWFEMSRKVPPNCGRYSVCDMYIVSNNGFVTIGFWYPQELKWLDAHQDVNITRQVNYWMKLPEPP